MQKNIMQKADSYAGKHRRHRMWQKLMTFLGCAVVFCTTYALILPAITMEKWECGLEEHTHTEECYAVLEEQLLPQCTADLEFADIIVHHHDENCYTADGTLWCTLAETDAPTATEETPETTAEAAAENAGEAPAEDAAVTEEAEAPAEPQPVVIEHQHTEQCMSLPAEPQLICNLPAHTHTEKCKPQKVLEGPVFRRITALEELTADENYLMISEDEETGEAWLLSSGDNVKIEKETGVDADGNAVALLTLDGTVLEPEKPETLDEALLWKTEEQPLISSMDEQLVLTLTEQEDETFGVELPTAVSTLALEEEKSEPAVKVTIYAVDAQAEGDSATYNCGREDIAHTEACYDPATGELKCTNQAHTHTHTAACTETPPDDIGIVLREIADEAALNAELADKKNMGFVLLREVGNTDGVTATLNMLTNDFNYSAEGLNQYYKQIGTEELPELTTTVPLDLGADKMWTAAGNADNAFTVTDAGNKTGKATLSRESGSWKVQKLAAANEPAVFALNPEGESGFTLYAAQEIAAAASENPQCTHNPPDNCYLNTYLDSFTPSNGDNPFGGCRDFNLVLFGNMTNMGATHGSAAIMGNIIGGNKGIVYDDSSVGNYAGDHMIKIDIGLILGGSRYTSENADGSYVEGNPGKIVTKNGSIIAREDQDSYTGYKFVMHDTMSKGLTFLTDAPDQLTVEIGKGTDKKTYSILTDESTGEGICFETESETNHTHGENCVICLKTEKVKSNDGDETGTEITLDFLKMLKWGKNSNSGAQTPKAGDNIVVTYKAKVNDNALSTDVESNEAKLEFSNDPYNWTETENTPVEKTYVTDFKLDILNITQVKTLQR